MFTLIATLAKLQSDHFTGHLELFLLTLLKVKRDSAKRFLFSLKFYGEKCLEITKSFRNECK